jgi:hypothetical protein
MPFPLVQFYGPSLDVLRVARSNGDGWIRMFESLLIEAATTQHEPPNATEPPFLTHQSLELHNTK